MMDIQESPEVVKDSMDSDILEKQEFFSTDSEVKNVLSSVSSKEVIETTEHDKCGLDISGDNIQSNRNLNVREIHETSPFKQAVRGFVLSKFTGLTEKIAKKLEDNRHNSQSVSVHSSESDLSISSLKMKEMPSEIISTSVSCELKSVVANDLALSEVLNIEDAVECIEEPKLSVNDIDIDNIGINIPLRNEIRSNSISLPSSPAHRFSKRASSVSYSLENVKSTKKDIHSPDLSFLCEENKTSDNVLKSEKFKQRDEIKLKDRKKKTTDNSYDDRCTNSDLSYLCNIYSGEKDDIPEFKVLSIKGISLLFCKLKRILSSLSLTHFFLLASIIIHNLSVISSYLTFIFDGMIIAYVFYSYICILAQTPIPNKSQNFPFVDPHLENASIHVQKTNRSVKGTVKVLKGEYDPDMVKNHPTDLVDITIENCCLKIYIPKKKSTKNITEKSEPSASYDLLGANVSIVPNGLSKGRIWNKKYPICIALPVVPTKSVSPNSSVDTAIDYLSPASSENNATNQKAVYIFALTDREKETLFWALLKNTEDSDNKYNEQVCDTSAKSDFSSMSYTSLLELNGEDNLSQSKDTHDDDNFTVVDKANGALSFENYMRNIFENYERMSKFQSRSRSFTDLTNLKEDNFKSSDSFMSKDDSFLIHSSKEYSVDWLNLVIGRIFYDFLSQKYWSDDVKSRIQKKLDKIEMPSFIESLEVSEVFLGASLPQIHTVSNLEADTNGVWFNCDFNYCGSFQMTLTAKLKMAKAKQFPDAEAIKGKEGKLNSISSESSDEEENESKAVSAKKKRLINRIEKWISYKHFQTVAQSRFVKKYVGDLSNMPLTLTVELNTLHGTLTLNIPPAPTDRIWYGFRKDPVLSLNAYPKVGTHEINLSAIVQMIEKKLIQEFKKAVVMPNMDFLLIPVMYTPIYEL